MTTYPIAETFHSIQGEGVFCGVQMFFIRLAGCNVGRYSAPVSGDTKLMILRAENPKLSICTSALGQEFLCDTDYHAVENMSVEALSAEVREKHVCITGGEPFLHDLQPLIDAFAGRGVQAHIETSGTRPIPKTGFGRTWITCSPKHPFIAENAPLVDEWKFVVDRLDKGDQSVEQQIMHIAEMNSNAYVYIQPVNGVLQLDQNNAYYVLNMMERHPDWRLSNQMHKTLGLR